METRRVSEGWCQAQVYLSLTLRVTYQRLTTTQNDRRP